MQRQLLLGSFQVLRSDSLKYTSVICCELKDCKLKTYLGSNSPSSLSKTLKNSGPNQTHLW